MIANLERIVSAVNFHPSGAFTFAGQASTQWNASLQSVLYAHCYTREFKGELDPVVVTPSGIDSGWLDNLSAANASRDRWEDGWKLQQFLPSGQIYAQKGTVTRECWPGEFITHGVYGSAPQPGTPISVFFPRESRTAQAGFYYVFGETQVAPEDDYPTVRYYWNLNRDGAAPLIKTLSSALNRYQVPFRFKIVNHPSLLNRSDPAVLYVSRRFYRIAADINLETHHQIADGLDEETPLFTLPLRKGLAFAEDPCGQESFGMSRCRMLAEALWLAFSEGRTALADRLDRINQHFAASGTSLDRPYLNLASTNSYEFPQ